MGNRPLWVVTFEHTKTSRHGDYKQTDWCMVEGDTPEEAKVEARNWVREFRFEHGYGIKNKVNILRLKQIKS